ncbi:VOC family protein [Pasteurellaceae bacterium LIM206]|nr:VOC family protein [Pasteurellaceae bacterium LIM206]
MQNSAQAHPLFRQPIANYADYLEFERKIQELAQQMQINLSDYEIDHLSIRVNSALTGKSWLTALLKCGKILSDNVVNGRVIYLISLDKPLLFAGRFVEIIELPFPKNKCYPEESWEHIEIVSPFLPNESTNDWYQRIQTTFLWNQSSLFNVKSDEPNMEGEQLPNPSVAVSFADKSDNHTCIKVHPYNIKNIIKV